MAQAVVLSAWHDVQGFGILYLSVIYGVMKANVWERTFTSAIVRRDFRHVAGDAATSRRPCFVVGVLFDGSSAGTIQRHRSVAVEAKIVGRLAELRVVVGAVDIVAGEAGYAAAVHHALHEIVALHAVFVGGAVGIVREGCLA